MARRISDDARGAQLRAEIVVFLGRDIDADHPVDAGLRARLGEPFRPAADHRIGIAHQDQRHVRVAGAEIGGEPQHVGGLGARAERAQVGGLDRRAVGHRIGERHAQLDHVRAALDQRVEIGRGVAVAGGDEADEGGAALGEGGGEARSLMRLRLQLVPM